MKKILRRILFYFCIYSIANSAFLAMCIMKFNPYYTIVEVWEKFLHYFCQSNIYDAFSRPGFIISAVIILTYEAVILFYPVLRWRRRRTVFNAWLIAMAGLLFPNYFYAFMWNRASYEYRPALIMTAGYAILWLIVWAIKIYRKHKYAVLENLTFLQDMLLEEEWDKCFSGLPEREISSKPVSRLHGSKAPKNDWGNAHCF